MENNPKNLIPDHHQMIMDIFEKKAEFHRRQAQLPIEQKIEILVALQKIALTIRPKQGEDDLRMVWELE